MAEVGTVTNPYGIERTGCDPAELAAWTRQVRRSIDEYNLHPTSWCTHNGTCDLRWRRWGVQ